MRNTRLLSDAHSPVQHARLRYQPDWNPRATHLVCAFVDTPKYVSRQHPLVLTPIRANAHSCQHPLVNDEHPHIPHPLVPPPISASTHPHRTHACQLLLVLTHALDSRADTLFVHPLTHGPHGHSNRHSPWHTHLTHVRRYTEVKAKGGIIVTKEWVLDQHAERKQFPHVGRYLLDVATAEDAMAAAGSDDYDDDFIVDDDEEEEEADDDDSDGVCAPPL